MNENKDKLSDQASIDAYIEKVPKAEFVSLITPKQPGKSGEEQQEHETPKFDHIIDDDKYDIKFQKRKLLRVDKVK
eukprot:CAMPEP_0168343466 /NCGR_PEP_ID=MMETSP0213-20121227/16111_1 /TAXON_ID=151035 /ORGANISM="Euplotes harpa, Strain FSP1.4" /LENGTH=75 /DNA_ID=CAMNT_0008350769 /DNA_START=617 /DNA_END=841 /DNA_ORIENTATION=-